MQQETFPTVVPPSHTSISQLSGPSHHVVAIDSQSLAELPYESNYLPPNELEGSSIWAKKLIPGLFPSKTPSFSNLSLANNENKNTFTQPLVIKRNSTMQKIFAFSPLTLNELTQSVQFLNEKTDLQSVGHELGPEFTSSSQLLSRYTSGYPICLRSKSIHHLTNLTVNLKKEYEDAPRFGSLERAHMEWMADNEITPNRLTHMRSRKLYHYRNFVYQGATPELRYAIIDSFLARKGMYPKKETSYIPPALNKKIQDLTPVLNKTFQDVSDTCQSWYQQGQSYALSLLNRKKEAGTEDSTSKTTSLLDDLEGKTIKIDWDKAFQHALRSHSIAQVLGIPPQVLFLSGFAVIDIKQIVLSDDLKNIEKMVYVAHIVLKTLIKILVVMGTQLFTTGLLGLGGIDVINVPFGVHGTRYLESQITERVFKVIDTHFDSMKNNSTNSAEKIIDV